MEDDAVGAGARVAELGDPPVAVGDALSDEIAVCVEELDAHAGGRTAALGVEHVGGDGHHCHNLPACLRCSRAISCSSARTSEPPRTTSTPPTTSRSTRCGPEKTRLATRSSAPPNSSPSVRHTAKSARLPG